MSNVIDLSAATRGSQNAIGEAKHDAQLKQTALAQMLSVLNMSKPQLPPLQMAAIEQLQMEGIAIGVEFLAQKCGGEENEWVKLIRSQIVEESARRLRLADEVASGADPTGEPKNEVADEVVDGVLHVSVGFAPEATKENAGAIRSALLLAFIQLSQRFPESEVAPDAARIAAQYVTEDDGDA
jgi:hypothetical protein